MNLYRSSISITVTNIMCPLTPMDADRQLRFRAMRFRARFDVCIRGVRSMALFLQIQRVLNI